MDFEWDENKRLKTIQERGIDFAETMYIFAGPTVEWPDNRKD